MLNITLVLSAARRVSLTITAHAGHMTVQKLPRSVKDGSRDCLSGPGRWDRAALTQAELITGLHGFPGQRTQAGNLGDRKARGRSPKSPQEASDIWYHPLKHLPGSLHHRTLNTFLIVQLCELLPWIRPRGPTAEVPSNPDL